MKHIVEEYVVRTRYGKSVRYRLRGAKRSGKMLLFCSTKNCTGQYAFQTGYLRVPMKQWPCAFCGTVGNLRKASVRTFDHDTHSKTAGTTAQKPYGRR